MKAHRYTIACSALLAVTGCSSDNARNNPADTADQFFFGSYDCSIDTTVSSPEILTDGAMTQVDNPIPDDLSISNSNSDTSDNVDCSTDQNTSITGPGVAQTGDGSATYNNSETPVSAVLIDEVFSTSGYATVQLSLHNGELRYVIQSSSVTTGTLVETTTRRDWGVYNADFALTMELSQAGDGTFTGGSFEVNTTDDAISGTELAQSNYAFDVIFRKDLDDDGTITTMDEVKEAISGNLNVSGAEPNWSVTYDLTLEDNTTITGFYNGSFYSIPTE